MSTSSVITDPEYSKQESAISSDELYKIAQKYFLKVREVMKQYDNRGIDESRIATIKNGQDEYTIDYRSNYVQIVKKSKEKIISELTLNMTPSLSANEEKILKKFYSKGFITFWNPTGRETLQLDTRTKQEVSAVDTVKAVHSAKELIKEICLLIPGISADFK